MKQLEIYKMENMNVNFFCYRLPGHENVIGYSSDISGEGFSEDAFIIAPFDCNRHHIINIPRKTAITPEQLNSHVEKALQEQKKDVDADHPFKFNTSRDEHSYMVDSIKDEINGGNLTKCVISRAIGFSGKIDVEVTFKNLCSAYPKAFVFCYYTPKTGLWMGATPELLLQRKDNLFQTVALAGTKETESGESWDEKNKDEQRVVRDFIIETFRRAGLTSEEEKTDTLAAGPVSHLITKITGRANSPIIDDTRLALELSPTPALSGYPKDIALKKISELEKHDRECYGGFIGPAKSQNNFSFYVNLRSMKIFNDGYTLFCGGGIMKESDAATEWEETERKSRTLLNLLVKI